MQAKLIRLLLPGLVLTFGGLLYLWLATEPEEAKRPPPKERLIKTRVAELERGDYQTVIRTQGVVQPHNQVSLTAQVNGRIIKIYPGFEDGAFFQEGEILIELDDADFQTAVVQAEANVARAKTLHAQEETRAKQARLNWEDLGYDEEPNELVLRLPQLREAKANVQSAEAQLERAKRNLTYVKVRAPFPGRVRTRNVGLGQNIGGSTSLGVIFAIDYAEVRLPIDGQDLGFLTLPEDPDDAPLPIKLRDALNSGNETVWEANIIRTEGVLDRNSLELFAIARVFDPFGRDSGHPPLRIGQPVIGLVPGRELVDVVVIPRAAVRKLENIFLIDKAEMTIHRLTIEPIFADQDNLVVRHPELTEDRWLSMTYLMYAPEGSKAEIIPEVSTTLETTASEAAGKTGKKTPGGGSKGKGT